MNKAGGPMEKYFYEVEEDDWGDSSAEVYFVNDFEERVVIGYIGSDPEDNTYYRAYSWVVPRLNEAYNKGFAAGMNSRCCGNG